MEKLAVFAAQRPRLLALAYRMLGSLSETVCSRKCLDHLRKAYKKREVYPGPWLPEPLSEALFQPLTQISGPEARLQQAENLTLAFLLLLERLKPLERAVFLLHEVFGGPLPQNWAARSQFYSGRTSPFCPPQCP